MFSLFQVGSGLNGTLKDSYVAYNLSLIDRCLYSLSPGCKFTITFWFQLPAEPHTDLLSTFKRNVDYNTGIVFGFNRDRNGDIFVGITITTTQPAQAGIRATGMMYPGIWHHIAFAYHNTTHFALYIDFVKRETSHFNDVFEPGYTPVPVPEAHMSSGYQSPPHHEYSGFGILDELTVFSEVLSAPQIMQLQISN